MELNKPVESHKTDLQSLYELAALHGLHVQFDEMGNEGPSNRRTFHMEVVVGDFVGYGCGRSKQMAKLHAAKEVVRDLSQLPVPENTTPYWCKPHHELLDPVERPFFFTNKDPVSALVQVLIVRKQKAPEFRFVRFYYENSKKRFCMAVKVGQMTCQATATSKKRAKAMAAKKMLEIMGFKKHIEMQNTPEQQMLFQQQIYQQWPSQKQHKSFSKAIHKHRSFRTPEELSEVTSPEPVSPAEESSEESLSVAFTPELSSSSSEQFISSPGLSSFNPEETSTPPVVDPFECVSSTEEPSAPEEFEPLVSIAEHHELPEEVTSPTESDCLVVSQTKALSEPTFSSSPQSICLHTMSPAESVVLTETSSEFFRDLQTRDKQDGLTEFTQPDNPAGDSTEASFEPQTSSPEKSSPEKSLLEKSFPEKGFPEKSSPKKDSTEKNSPEWRFPEKCSLEESSPEKSSPEKSSPEKSSSEKSSPEKSSSEKSSPEKGSSETSSSETSSPETSSPEKSSSEKSSPEKSSSEKSFPEKNSPEKSSPEKSSSEMSSAEKSSSEKSSSEKSSPKKSSPEKSSPEKSSPEKSSPEMSSSETNSSEKSSPEKSSPENSSPERVEPECDRKGQCSKANHCMIAAMIKKLVRRSLLFPDVAEQVTLVQRLLKVEDQVLVPEDSELRVEDLKTIGKAAAKSLLQEFGSASVLFSQSDQVFFELTVKRHLNVQLKAFLSHPPEAGRPAFFSGVWKVFRRSRIPSGPLNSFLSSEP